MKTWKFFSLAVATFLSITMLACGQPEPTTIPRIIYKEGNACSWRFWLDGNVSGKGKDIPTVGAVGNVRVSGDLKVTDVEEDGAGIVEITLQDLSFIADVNSPEKEHVDTELLTAAIPTWREDILGYPLTITISRDGDITKLNSLEDFLDRVSASDPSQQAMFKLMMEGQIRKMEQARQTTQFPLPRDLYPTTITQVGDTTKQEVKTVAPNGLPIDATVETTLVSRTDGIATFRQNIVIDLSKYLPLLATEIAVAGMNTDNTTASCVVVVEMSLNEASGWTESSTFIMDINASIEDIADIGNVNVAFHFEGGLELVR